MEKDLKITLEVETDKSEKNLKSFKTQVKNTDLSLSEFIKTSKDLDKSTDELNKSSSQFTKTLKDSLSVVKNFSNTLASVAIAGKEVVSTLATITTDFGPLGIIREIGKDALTFGRNIGIASVALSGLGAIASNEFLQGFMNTQKEMANVNSILLESDINISNLSDKVRDLSLSLKLATETEITQGLYDVASAGLTGADGMKVMEVAVKEAKAGLTDVRTAARLTTQTLLGLGKSADEAESIANTLFKTVQRGVLEFSDLANGMGRITGTAKSLSITLETLGGGLAVLTKKGTLPDQAFTNLNSLLLSFAAQSEESKKKAKELGIEMDANAIRTKGFVNVLAEMVQAAEATGNVEATLFTLLGRQEALDAALKLGAENAKDLRLEGKEFTKDGNALVDSLGKQEQSIAETISKIKVSFSALRNAGGEAFADLIGYIAPSIEKMLDYLNSLDRESQKWLFKLTAIALSAPAVITALGGITLGVIALIAQITIVKFVIAALGINMSVVTAILGRFSLGVIQASGTLLGLTTAVTTASEAFAVLKAAFISTVATLGAFTLAVAGTIFIIHQLLKTWADYKIEVENINKADRERYDTITDSAKKLHELREKERQGLRLNAKENELYAKSLMRVAGSNEITRKEWQKRMDLSKKLAQEEKALEKANTGLTKDQLDEKKALFEDLNSEEIKASKNKFAIQKYELDKWKIEEKAKLTEGLYTKEEIEKANLQIDRIYKKKLSDAWNSFSKEEQDKRESDRKKDIDRLKSNLNMEIQLVEKQLKSIKLSKKLSDDEKLVQTEKFLRQEAGIYAKYGKSTKSPLGALEKEELIEKSIDKEIEADKIKETISINIQKRNRTEYDKRLDNINHIAIVQKLKEDEILNHKIYADNQYINTLQKGSEEYIKITRSRDENLIKLADIRLKNLHDELDKELKDKEDYEKEAYDISQKYIKIRQDKEKEASDKAEKERLESLQKQKEAYQNIIDNVSRISSLLNDLGFDDLGKELNIVSSKMNTLFKDASGGNIFGLIVSGIGEAGKALIKYNKSQDDLNELVKSGTATQQDFNSVILKSSTSTLPLFGDAIGSMVMKLTDWLGITRDLNKAKEDTISLIKQEQEEQEKLAEDIMTQLQWETEQDKKLRQLQIDNIDDERIRREQQLAYDLEQIDLSNDLEEVKIENRKKLRVAHAKWLKDFEEKENNERIKNDEKALKQLEDNRKKAFENLLDQKKHALKMQKEQTENLIKQSQLRISQIDFEVNKIKTKYDKLRLSLSPDASKQFQSDRQSFLSDQVSTSKLVRMPVTSFELQQETEKEAINNLFLTGEITQEEKLRRLKALSVQANIYFGNISKTLVKGTREQAEYQRKANQEYATYRDLVNETYNLRYEQEVNIFETEKRQLTDINAEREQQVKNISNNIDKMVTDITLAFKDASGQWKQAVIDGLITPLQTALSLSQQIGTTSDSGTTSGSTDSSTGTAGGGTGGDTGQVGVTYPSGTSASLTEDQKRINMIEGLANNDYTKPLQWFWDEYGELSVDALKALTYERGLPKYDTEYKYYRYGSPVLDRPTKAIIGEAGAEKVINASQMQTMYENMMNYKNIGSGGNSSSLVLNINNPVIRESSDIDKLALKIESAITKNNRRAYSR